ncbi:MAG TPA: tetratricopeptide repeat protein [Verrucomicrobiae bacterium]|nr:tetratricopeptide repeat protein [Verrucomicrobiae bacterium]
MNSLPRHYFRRAARMYFSVFFICTVCLYASAQMAEIKTNTAWLPLKELLKKWESVPWEQVQGEAEKGNRLAQHYLGYCYMQGLRITPNPEMGAFWYRRALTNGYLPSANNLGFAYQHGQLGSEDFNKAVYYYTYAAERGLALASFNLGLLYETQGQQSEAFQFFQRAADQGGTDAMVELYRRYWDGNGVAPDHAKAMQWLIKAADASDPQAQYLMGYRCENPDHQVSSDVLPAPNLIEACQWYRRAADQNYAEAQYHLGLFYLAGRVVDPDEERGLELIRAAADQGLNEALSKLAHLYAHGIGEPRSAQESPMKLYERAHDYSYLIRRYRYGIGTDRDMIAVARCYVSLANDPKSWFWSPEELVKKIQFKPTKRMKGMMMDNGFYWPAEDSGPEPPDEDLRFLSLYLKSALGDGQSASEIANCYLVGKDAPKSALDAWCWFTFAAQDGSDKATAQLHRLESQMNSETVDQAREQLPGLLQELTRVGALLRAHGGEL